MHKQVIIIRLIQKCERERCAVRLRMLRLLRFGNRRTDATDAGDQYGADDQRTRQLLAWLVELLRHLRDALDAEGAGSVDTAQAAVHDLEASAFDYAALPKAHH
jgi:hypothetical protein